MEYSIEKNRVVYKDGGRELGQVVFPAVNIGVVKITHTFVDESLRGQGIAAGLMQRAADSLRASGRHAMPQCSYAVKWFEEHPEYANVLAK